MNPLAARRVEAFDLSCIAVGEERRATSDAFVRWRGRVHFFWWTPKETEPKKNVSPTRPKPAAFRSPGFSDSASCLGRKTPPIHGRRPPG